MTFSTECPQGELQPLPTSLGNKDQQEGLAQVTIGVTAFSLGAAAWGGFMYSSS